MTNNAPPDPGNQVHHTDDATFYVLWRGRVVYRNDGKIRKFPNEARAWEYLAECDRLGREAD